MGYVGAGFVVNQANTTDGGAINTVAYASTGASAGQYVGGAYAVNLYTGPFGTLSLDFINNYYAIVGVSKTFSQVITFSRASNATRFAPDGVLQYAPHNLLLQSQTFDNASWTKTNSTVTANTVVAPDGTLTGDKLVENTATSTHNVTQSFSFVSGTTYTYSIFVKAGERTAVRVLFPAAAFTSNLTANFDISTGAWRTSSPSPSAGLTLGVTNVGNGWYRISASAAATASATSTILLYLLDSPSNTGNYTGDGTSGLFIWGAQLAVGPNALDYTPTTTAVVYGPRFDYDPTTLAAKGLLIEEQRTNSIRNNTMVGAVAGTPGTAPTNYTLSSGGGVTRNIVGVGTENGITYIDVQFSSAGANNFFIIPEPGTQVAALSGQNWTSSFYIRLIGGTLANLVLDHNLQENNAAGAFLASTITQFVPTTAALVSQRNTVTRTLNNALTAFVQGYLRGVASGAYDITLRIGLPQLELGAFATSVIPTATAAVTRSADVASINTLSPWFNQPEGALYSEWQSNPNAYARYVVSIEQAASSATRIDININSSNIINPRTVVSGAAVATLTGGTYTAGTIAKVAFGYKSADYASSFNGAAVVTATTAGALPSSLATMYLGSITGGTQINGYLRRIAYYNRRLTNAELQVLTS